MAADDATDRASAAHAELKALNARFIQNFVTNDVASHDAILHRDFLCIASDGRRVERGPYLERWRTGFDPAVIVYWDTRDERITIAGECALVRATNKHVVVRDGREETGMTTYTDTYVRENGRWLCVQAQLGPVAEAHWPGDDTVVNAYVRGRKVV